jgi:hypothetical protein
VSSYRFAFDDAGAPLLLVAAPAEAPPEQQTEPGREHGSVARRRDAIVDAARTLEDLSPAGVERFVRQRWRGDRPITSQDISSFASEARSQRAHDVADALHHRIHRSVHGIAKSKQPHVSIPRGIIRKSLASLDGEQLSEVFARLQDRGWSRQQILRYGVRRFDSPERSMKSLLEKGSGSS